uniref:Uncharacterized protein n=1 Tax=Onchocerca volvulus TaxID=6282 RepID=A0A8R1XRI8_ONCVO
MASLLSFLSFLSLNSISIINITIIHFSLTIAVYSIELELSFCYNKNYQLSSNQSFDDDDKNDAIIDINNH